MALFAAGDVIFKSEPWAYIVRTKYADQVCYHCLEKPKTDKLHRCSRCKFAHYCSEACQTKDWKLRHKPECTVLGEAAASFARMFPGKQFLFDDFMVVCQISIKLKKGENEDAAGACEPQTKRTFNDLLSHETEFAKDTGREIVYKIFQPYFSRIPEVRTACPDCVTYLQWTGKFAINAFTVWNSHEETVGKALYLGPSVIDHSCVPNACYGFVGTTIKVKAMTDILRFEDVRINYTDTFVVPEVRQASLMRNYFFLCDCAACTDPNALAFRHAVKCAATTCTSPVPLTDETEARCRACGMDCSEQIKNGKRLVQGLLKGQKMLKEMEDGFSQEDKLDMLMTTERNAKKVLHPSNFLLGIVYKQLSNLYSSNGDMDKAGEHMKKAILPMRIHLNKYDTEYTGALSFVGAWMMKKGNFIEGRPIMQELQKINAVILDI